MSVAAIPYEEKRERTFVRCAEGGISVEETVLQAR
jgi:hypothetical protein